MKTNFRGGVFYNAPLDAVFLLSLMEFQNIVSVDILMKFQAITTTYTLDMILLVVILLGVNSLYFFYKKRYLQIVEKYKKAGLYKQVMYVFFTIIYSVSSCYFLYLVHSHKYVC